MEKKKNQQTVIQFKDQGRKQNVSENLSTFQQQLARRKNEYSETNLCIVSLSTGGSTFTVMQTT